VSIYLHAIPGATKFSDTGAPSVRRCASGRSGLSMFCLAERSVLVGETIVTIS
jgi:hypothetical protein